MMLTSTDNANLLLASYLPPSHEVLLLSSLIPILVAARLGARVSDKPFQPRRIVGASLGVITGVLVIPLAFGIATLVVNLSAPQLGLQPGGFAVYVIMYSVIYLMTSSTAYAAGMIGRPRRKTPAMTMQVLNQNLLEIEEFVSSESGGEEGSHVSGHAHTALKAD